MVKRKESQIARDGNGTKQKNLNLVINPRELFQMKNKNGSTTTAAFANSNRMTKSPKQQFDSMGPILGEKKKMAAHTRHESS